MTTREDKDILKLLGELGNKKEIEQDITFEGTKLIVPARMSPAKARLLLTQFEEAQEAEYVTSRQYKTHPWDGAFAVERAVRELTGGAVIGYNSKFFGPSVKTVEVNISPHEKVKLPWGAFPLELIEGIVQMSTWMDNDGRTLFAIHVKTKRKFRAEADGFLNLVDAKLKAQSLYKGRAFDAQNVPAFLDLDAVDSKKTVYAAEVWEHLEANVWAPMRYTDEMRRNSLPLKRSVLLYGPYGTGKTLAAMRTAQIATENGWTFVYARPGRDKLEDARSLATIYAPAVVFFEDVDTISDPNDQTKDGASYLLSMFDGLNNKGEEVITVLTTNHPEKIHRGLLRPGRLDAVIRIGELDAAGIETMIWNAVDKTQLDGELDMKRITDEMEGFMPAFVREAINHTIRYSISHNGGKPGQITTEHFVNAAKEFRPQLDMMNDAGETSEDVTIDDLVKVSTQEALAARGF